MPVFLILNAWTKHRSDHENVNNHNRYHSCAEGLAVQDIVKQTFEPFAFKCFGYDGSGLPFCLFSMPQSLAQLLHIMAVNHISVEAEETNWLKASDWTIYGIQREWLCSEYNTSILLSIHSILPTTLNSMWNHTLIGLKKHSNVSYKNVCECDKNLNSLGAPGLLWCTINLFSGVYELCTNSTLPYHLKQCNR